MRGGLGVFGFVKEEECHGIREHIPGAEARWVAVRNVRAEALTYLEAKTLLDVKTLLEIKTPIRRTLPSPCGGA
jgi:hypothetical protein